MRQNKTTLVLFIAMVLLFALLIILLFRNKFLEKELDNWARLTNNLNIERDFILYKAINENKVGEIKKNLELNFMFHLTAIETDGIKSILDIQNIDRVCKKYNIIKVQFNNEYKKLYPSSIKGLGLLCEKGK